MLFDFPIQILMTVFNNLEKEYENLMITLQLFIPNMLFNITVSKHNIITLDKPIVIDKNS